MAPGHDPEETIRLLIIVMTVLGAPLIGLALYWFSQRSSRVKFQDRRVESSPGAAPGVDPKALLPTILAHLNQLPAPAQQRERVARTVSDIVTKTLEAQVGHVKRELDERYGQLIEEGRRTEMVLQRKYQEVLQEKKQTASVLESIAEGLVVINNKSEVVMMNPAAEKLLGVSQEERIGKPLLDQLKDEQLVSLVRGSQEEREIVLAAKQDSTKRVLRASNAVISDEDGKTVGMVTVLSDVTKQRELEQMKLEFVSKVGHELRTPLMAMQHALSLLVDQVAGPLSEEQKQFAMLSQRNLERLNALLNDLLDLSKLEAHRMDLRLSPCAIGAVIQTVCDSLEPWARAKALIMNRQVPADLPPVACDQARIIQVLTNLVGNAVKFTPKQGRITVAARHLLEEQAIEVGVTDTGVGIAKEDLPKLFGKFQQVGERSATDIAGTGLGLAIAKELVELHHGRIWAESDGKQGARFVFVLSLSPSASPSPSPAKSL